MLSVETAQAINAVIQPPEGTQEVVKITDLLAEAYPEITLNKEIGKGAFSKVFSFSYLSSEGNRAQAAFKMVNFWTATKEENHRCFKVTNEQIGGEWFSLLDLGPHVLKTFRVLYFDHKILQFKLMNSEEFQELFANSKSEQNLNLTLVGAISEYFPEAITLNQCNSFTSAQIQKYAREILLGLQAIHNVQKDNLQLIHRDIKPRNILITPDGIKLLDLGLARFIEKSHKRRYSSCGTLPNMAPEVLQKAEYDISADFYSVATVLFYMATKRHVCRAKDKQDYLLYHLREPRLITNPALAYINPKLKDLIDKLGHPYSENRITAEEARAHLFFQ
ncbi:MAG: protein kinase [Candidatus Algichlamydia australiensis]|nr:protein kinase [Chlamydiales bacterium]